MLESIKGIWEFGHSAVTRRKRKSMSGAWSLGAGVCVEVSVGGTTPTCHIPTHTLNNTHTYTIVLLCQTVKGMWKRLYSH